MQTILLSEIYAGPRQRRSITQDRIVSLANSIASKGLMHAIVCRKVDGALHLVAGRRRMLAIGYLASRESLFSFDGNVMLPGEAPYVLVTDLSYVAAVEAEYEENMERVDLPWQDQVDALNMLHEMRQMQNPSQTVKDTAQEIDEKHVRSAENRVARARVIAERLDDPDVQRAPDIEAAYRIASQKIEAGFTAELARRELEIKPSAKHVLIYGDMREQLPKLPNERFSVIIADPPYGIGADSFGDAAALAHQYEDSPETAGQLYAYILEESFRLAAAQAHLYVFCDIEFFLDLRALAAGYGWKSWRTPLVWHKPGGQGHAPNRELGFRRSYELILFANKGDRPLNSIYKDVLDIPREADMQYAAQKPPDLYATLLRYSALPGDFVLDPCCGSGPILPAAEATNTKAVAIEQDEKGYKLALERLAKL